MYIDAICPGTDNKSSFSMEGLMKIKGKRKMHRSIWQILWITLVISISSAGVSVAAWHDGTQIMGTVTTGSIKPLFTNVYVVDQSPNDSSCTVFPEIKTDDKTMTLTVNNAHPGYQAQLRYEITNKGSVPVRYVPEESADYESGIVKVVNQFPKYPEDVVLEGGGSAEGTLTLIIDATPEEDAYNLQIQMPMYFEQAIPRVAAKGGV